MQVGTSKGIAVLDTHTYEVEEGHFLRGGTVNDGLVMGVAGFLK